MASLAETLRQAGYVTPQGVTGPNAPLARQLKNYVTNVIPTAAQNLAQQRADIDASLTMGDQGIQVGDREAFERQMAQVPNLMGLTAYHGSPASFTKFDKSKIGTGSGNDFGYGAYFAESPEIAKSYRVLPNQSEFIKLGDKVVKTISKEGQLLNDVYQLGRKAALKKYPDQANYIKTIDPNKIEFEGGNLYKVDIPDEYVPKMINWSSSEQSPEIYDILKKAGLPTNARGEDIYFAAIEKAGSSDAQKSGFQKAAEYLNSLGIKGITYPQRSYESNAVSKNFVVFDPTDVKILEQNSKPLTRKEILEQELKKVVE